MNRTQISISYNNGLNLIYGRNTPTNLRCEGNKLLEHITCNKHILGIVDKQRQQRGKL